MRLYHVLLVTAVALLASNVQAQQQDDYESPVDPNQQYNPPSGWWADSPVTQESTPVPDVKTTKASKATKTPKATKASKAPNATKAPKAPKAAKTTTAPKATTVTTAPKATNVRSATQEGSDATQTSTNSTSSGDHATFGTITSKSGECVIGNPNTYVSTADIDWIWTNRIGPSAPTRDANWNVMDNKNWIMDHIVKNKGSLNYCVRWDSTEKLSKATASKFKAMLERQYAAWNHWLIGYDCWPYNEIKVNVVGFAVKEASLLDWTDDSLGTITVGDLDSDGVPQCDQKCYRFYDDGLGAWSDTSGCKGEPFDISLWPKQGLEGGFGYDWGQEVNLENMLSTLDQDQLVIVAHEIGHGFGLPDFYEDADKPNAQWPNCIMMAGSSMTVTDSDGWMLRRVLEHLKPRYNF
ncbi:Neutral zinc metallopeptidase [Phytophthora cinnamomi]|uniref:Neutral zinc metallopeptidase n=1 Tax=Phytophthora cinnamomi TaxID=4785 RepID=UPI00355A4DFB|nr:Neutral zinc metallopeptidase [Phytophthora cinnamomi]